MRQLLLKAIREINKDLNLQELENVNENTPLFELLDSVAVLDLILEIEGLLEDKYGKYIQIADDKSMDAVHTPFKTFQILLKYLERRVNG